MKGNRWGHRDATMVLIAFRHGVRASELVDLRWEQVDLEHALPHVRRLKNGSPAALHRAGTDSVQKLIPGLTPTMFWI
jgi:integrase